VGVLMTEGEETRAVAWGNRERGRGRGRVWLLSSQVTRPSLDYSFTHKVNLQRNNNLKDMKECWQAIVVAAD